MTIAASVLCLSVPAVSQADQETRTGKELSGAHSAAPTSPQREKQRGAEDTGKSGLPKTRADWASRTRYLAQTLGKAHEQTAKRGGHSRGYLTAVKLNRALVGTPMRGSGFALVLAGRKWDVHPAFIAAVAGLESSYGAAACRGNRMNVWGLSSCGRGWYVPQFRSWRHATEFFARWFRSRWTPAVDMWAVGRSYCPPCGSSWGERVAYRMRLLGFPATTRWK